MARVAVCFQAVVGKGWVISVPGSLRAVSSQNDGVLISQRLWVGVGWIWSEWLMTSRGDNKGLVD